MNDATEDKTLASFFMNGRSVRFSAGEIVLHGDDAHPDIFFISSGYVRVYSINDGGEEYLHIIYKKGDIFPLIWALKDIRRRVFYEALTTTVLWKMSKETFLEYVEAHSSPVTYSLMRQLAEQFNVFADRLDNLEYRSAYERVVYRLLFLASRFGTKNGNSVTIEAPITHKLIGQSINLARESVSRQLEKLTQAGLIGTKNGKLVIRDIRKLHSEFSEPVTLDLWGLE